MVSGRSSTGISNSSGTINITDGEINSSGSDSVSGIYNSNGTVNIKGGTISSSNSTFTSQYAAYGIKNSSGTINITDGTISSSTSSFYAYGIYNESSGVIQVAGGKISSSSSRSYSTYGIYNESRGTIQVTGGEISSSNYNSSTNPAYGIYNNSSGTITVGIKSDGVISTEEPNIIATYAERSTSYKGYGIYNTRGTFNFYDGRIEGSTRAVQENSEVTEVEEFQKPQYSEDYKIYAYGLDATSIAKIGDKTYLNLQDAINEATESDVIEILRGIQYTNQDSALTIPSNKNITIDLQNYPIISAIEDAVFIVEGRLKIINTVEGENGKITSSYEKTIYVADNGKLEIQGGTVRNTKSDGYTIENSDTGVVNIYSGIVGADNCSIYNTGKVYVAGGTITANKNAITNTGSGVLNIENGTITATSSTSTVIKNQENASINMYGGEIRVSEWFTCYGINNTSLGNINIIGGNISGLTTYTSGSYRAYGIYSTVGIINIGTKDGNVDNENPSVLGTTNGIYTSEDCILNIYDGIIKGEETAISGNITSLEEQSEIVVGEENDEDNNTYETVSLVKVDSPIASVDGTQYYSLQEAIDNINRTGTVQILRAGTVGETINNLSNKNITIDLNGNTLNMYTQFENNGTLNIKDTNLSSSGILTGYKDRVINNNGNLTLSGGTISGVTYGIYNNKNGITNISGGTLNNNEYGIYNVSGGTVNVTNGTITGNTYGSFNYGGDINVSGGNITGNEYGVYNSSGTTNVTNGIINANTYGIYNNSGTTNISNLTITGNTTEVVNGGTGTINILSGNIISDTIAVTNTSSGRINIGSQDLVVDRENLVIQGEQYGIANTGTGSIAFYDGIVKGKEGSIQGYYLYTETGYIAQTNVVDGYYCDTLALSGTVTTVAKIGDIEYTNLQSAINACTSDTPTTITLVNSINSTQMFTIEEGQNVIIDLNGSTIATGTLEKLIENAGTLTIIDTNDRQTGKISNTSGIAINNTGTLNLGQDDGTVSTTCPEVVGKSTGIVNTGTFNFYDGIIKGAEALSGNVTARPDGYVINSSTDEATGMKQLTLGR